MQLVAAAPNTRIVQYPSGLVAAVVVAWAHVQGSRVDPITPINRGTAIYPNEAIQFDNGEVVYPAKSLCFETFSDWESWMSENFDARDEGEPEKAAAPSDSKPSKPSAAKPAATKAPPSGPIIFGSKKYATKSFWSAPSLNAIFEIEGDQFYPADERCVKIKRDEFFELRKQGWSKIDPHQGEVHEEEPEAPEPSFVEDIAGDEPDDDGDDLI